jgi:hypothetical protein
MIEWETVSVRLGDLQPWPRNPRQIKSKEAQRLAESFDEFGQVETIAIGPDAEVYNGHQRLAVLLQQHGPDYQLDARQASRPLTEHEREKLTVYLHKGAAGEWDFDALADFEVGDLLEWGFEPHELGINGLEDFDPVDESTQPRLDQKAPVTCPHCGTEFVPK